MNNLRWIGEPISDDIVSERRFDLVCGSGRIPGILWAPTQQKYPAPLVLMGHGGSGHKRADRQVLLGRHFAREYQIASVSIDGPYHGDRVSTPLEPQQYQKLMNARGIDKVVDGMIHDWHATLDALCQLDFIDGDRIAYLGMSMGTRFGLPFAAAVGDRLRCAVLGKYGLRASADLNMASRFTRDAPRINVPVLFHMQWDDELFPRVGQFELFELIGAHDKQLIAFPGPHNTTVPVAIRAWCQFIAQHLDTVPERFKTNS